MDWCQDRGSHPEITVSLTSHLTPYNKPHLPGLHLTNQAGPDRGTRLWKLPGNLAGGVKRIFEETVMVVTTFIWSKINYT